MEIVGTTQPVATAIRPSDAAAPGRRRAGLIMMLTSSVSNQTGAGLAALAFPAIGPVGVVAVRQLVTASVLVPLVRPRLRGLRRGQWLPVIGLVVVFSVMNLSLYASIERIGLGLAVTLEFLGPLGVAIVASRRALDLACFALTAVGVVTLTHPGPASDAVGIGLALLAAACWACYILLNRALGRRLPGLQGTATASLLTVGVWIPVAVVWFVTHPPTAAAIALAVACGLLSSVLPYACDLQALRRVPVHVFGALTGLNPVWAALAGWILLGQMLSVGEWSGVAMIVVANVVVSVPRHQERRATPLDGLSSSRWSGRLRSPRR